ncbi:MAG TPA: LolA-related protein [Rhodanobacteraceae bacterium]
MPRRCRHILHRWLAVVLACGFAAGAVAQPPVAAPSLAQTLLAGIARTPPASTPFVQVAYRGMLDRPLVVSGTLHWFGGDRMQRDVVKPFRETAKVTNGELSVQRGNGKTRHVPLARAPQVGAMLVGFRALLGGDVTTLQRDFTLSAQGAEAHWVVVLTPRTAQLRRQLDSITIDGAAHAPRCLTVRAADGDSSITLLGAMATAGLRDAAPQESALAARCRNP